MQRIISMGLLWNTKKIGTKNYQGCVLIYGYEPVKMAGVSCREPEVRNEDDEGRPVDATVTSLDVVADPTMTSVPQTVRKFPWFFIIIIGQP